MRGRIVLLLVLLLLLLAPRTLSGQAETAGPAVQPPDTRAADLLAELGKSTYTAKRAIPATENIFVESGRVMDGLFSRARQEHGTAVAAGKITTVTKVVLLDRAVQVFLEKDQCALIILPKEDQFVKDMTLPQLLELARAGLGTLFNSKPEPARLT